MRILALAILAIVAVSAAPSVAQTYDPKYPVCLQIFVRWNDSYFECGYTTMNQCRMSASGRSAMCIVNPYYTGTYGSRRDNATGGLAGITEIGAVTAFAVGPAVARRCYLLISNQANRFRPDPSRLRKSSSPCHTNLLGARPWEATP